LSVNYKSALIYGYDVSEIEVSIEQYEVLEDHGFNMITNYDGKLLHIGVNISSVDEDDVSKMINLEENYKTIKQRFKGLVYSLSTSYKELLVPVAPTIGVYHICYAC
jgi:hypothetical protein